MLKYKQGVYIKNAPDKLKLNNHTEAYNKSEAKRFRALSKIACTAAGILISTGIIDTAVGESMKDPAIITEHTFANKNNSLSKRELQEREKFEKTHATIFLAGYSQVSPLDNLNATADAWKEYGKLVQVNYSKDGVDINKLSNLIGERLVTKEIKKDKDVVNVNLSGYSMGGLTAIHLADQLAHDYPDNIHINLIVANSSPSDINSIKSAGAQIVTRIGAESYRNSIPTGGPILNSTLQYIYDKNEKGWLEHVNPLDSIDKALDRSNKLQNSQSDIIEKGIPVDKVLFLKEKFDTKCAYTYAENPDNDSTIDVITASKMWNLAWDGECSSYSVVNGGHANAYAAPIENQQTIKNITDEIGILSFETYKKYSEIYSSSYLLDNDNDYFMQKHPN